MSDIEDIGLNVRTSNFPKENFFNIKVRSNISKLKRKLSDVKNKLIYDNDDSYVKKAIATDCSNDDNCCGESNCCKTEIAPLNDCNNNNFISNLNIELNTEFEVSNLPWRNIIYLRTWGCSHNNSDSEYMGGLLLKAGYTITANKSEAALWLLNSCTVKTPSETQLSNHIIAAKKLNKYVVVAGCVSQASPSEPWLKGISIIGVQQIDRVVEVVDETLKGNVVRFLSAKRLPSGQKMSLDLPKMRRNEFIEILAINSGCLNHCTYCKTKQARGDLHSFDLESLVKRAYSALVNENCRELWLTSEDLGAWGRDIGMVLPDLLNALVKVIPDGCMMRLGMTNPPYILDHLEEIAEILRHPRVYSFLHIPVQSGNNAVLNDMKREYTCENFCYIVDYMIKHVPNIYIATDFICAFPTETVEDFQDSLDLVKRYKFPSLFINQYYPRPGTPAARLKKITTKQAKLRTNEMTEVFYTYSRYNSDRIGTFEKVLICEMATDGIHYVGHNKSYEHILVAPLKFNYINKKSLLGEWTKVKITNVSKFYMKAEITSFIDFSLKDLSFIFILIKEFYLSSTKGKMICKILMLQATVFLYLIVEYLLSRFTV